MESVQTTSSSSFRDDLLLDYSDPELVRYIAIAPRVSDCTFARWLSPILVAKRYDEEELQDVARAMNRAYQLGVRVPLIKRVVTGSNNYQYMIMEAIPGETLESVWGKLDWLTTFKLALQFRGYMQKMRSATSDTAGSLATGQCRSFYLADTWGLPPKSTLEDVKHFLGFWSNYQNMSTARQNAQDGTSFDPGKPGPPVGDKFVFTHHDLAPQNMILDTSGKLWIIDWDYAGFYPQCFEYACAMNVGQSRPWKRSARWRWDLFVYMGLGRDEGNRQMLDETRWKCTSVDSAAARRFELLKNGGPTGRQVE